MVWRRLLVHSDSSIADFHYTLQIAMGWSDSHLHRFRIYGKDFGVYHIGGPIFDDNPKKIRLANLHFRPGERFLYEYDLATIGNTISGWSVFFRLRQSRPTQSVLPVSDPPLQKTAAAPGNSSNYADTIRWLTARVCCWS
jgi:Plasmid pRiA4b ORF-3-like protein